MERDPSLFTDSTGDGMAGAQDIPLSAQRAMKQTFYSGSKLCLDCGTELTPVHAMYSPICPSCSNRKAQKLVKGRMS
jgi:predicted RNA-binding Zn-ribbon protein involved in translation (DUF1610 family)